METQSCNEWTRTCRTCDKTFPIDRFRGGNTQCKNCKIAVDNKKQLEKWGSWAARNCFVKYGITLENRDAMLKAQKGCCAICDRPNIEFGHVKVGGAVVDHCHRTGKVRGILCTSCNKALGLFYDDKDTLQRAMEYLS